MRFSIQSLLAAVALASLSLWSWRSHGMLGVVGFVVFVSVIVGNLAIALWGAKFRCALVAGVLGGGLLWAAAPFCVTTLNEFSLLREFGLYEEQELATSLITLWFEDSFWVFAILGAIVGLVCGLYARHKHRTVGGRIHKGAAYGVALTLAGIFLLWVVWKTERSRVQRDVVAWAFSIGGQAHYDFQVRGARKPPGPDWLRKRLGIDFFDDVVSLTGGAVRDATPVGSLTTLTSLDLSNSPLADVSPLAKLVALERLDLSGTLVQDVRPLTGLRNLRSLQLDQTDVHNLSPLAGLADLSSLGLADTQVGDVSALAGLGGLTRLTLERTTVSDITSLAKLRNLQMLRINGTAVADLSPLAELPFLSDVNLQGTAVRSIGPLATSAPNLSRLVLSDTLVTDLSVLAESRLLSRLDLSGTSISDISALASLKYLRELDLNGTQVTDLRPLADLERLSRLDLSDSQVTDISPLAASKHHLRELDLSGTRATDVSALLELRWLSRLYLARTPIKNVSPLAQLSYLRVLDLKGTRVAPAALEELQNALPNCNINR